MISQKTVLMDDFDDEVSPILLAMRQENGWTARKSALRKELVSLLSKMDYLTFSAAPENYVVSQVGESYLYDVPLYKQGLLKKFRGERLRIVCVGSGRYKRIYMVGAVGKTPDEFVVTTLIHTYSFPSFIGNSTVVYKTRRFLVFKLDGAFETGLIKELNEAIDYDKWNLILVDGKDSVIKGRLRLNDDGSYSSALLGWKGQHSSPTLKDAVRHLTDRYICNRSAWAQEATHRQHSYNQ